MATATPAKPGREAKFKLDVEASVNSGASVKNVELKGEDKTVKGKIHTVDAQEIEIADLNQALALFGGDEAKLWEFMSDSVTTYLQRTPRQKLNVLREGVEKMVARNVKSLIDGGMTDDVVKTLGFENVEAFVRSRLPQ